MRRHAPGLATLFPRLTREAFLRRHWPNRPAWTHRPAARLGTLEELGEMSTVMTLAVRSRIEMKAMFPGTHHESNEVPADTSTALSLYDSGATIAFSAMHRWHEGVSHWTRALATELSVPPERATCNLYMTPRGKGVPMHFDDHEVIVVQVGGRKRWRIAENQTVLNPMTNSGAVLTEAVEQYASGPAPTAMPDGRTVPLAPGSVLFLPRGYWHSTDAQEASISLTFGFRVPAWAEVVAGHVATQLTASLEWRQPAWGLFREDGVDVSTREEWTARRTRLAALLNDIDVERLAPREVDPLEQLMRARRQPRRRPRS